jgi:hypothetical protein
MAIGRLLGAIIARSFELFPTVLFMLVELALAGLLLAANRS